MKRFVLKEPCKVSLFCFIKYTLTNRVASSMNVRIYLDPPIDGAHKDQYGLVREPFRSALSQYQMVADVIWHTRNLRRYSRFRMMSACLLKSNDVLRQR